MHMTISGAGGQEKPIVENLAALYLHDLSEYTEGLHPNAEGLFAYDSLELYWEKEELYPLLIRVDNVIAGFILLNRPPYAPKDADYLLNDFFILRQYRRKGLGKEAVKRIFAAYPGRYMIVQLQNNLPAIRFWHRLYEDCQIPYEESTAIFDEESCLVQKFTV